MAGERIRLEVRAREKTGSRETRRLREQGLIPGVLYGRGKKSYTIAVPERVLRQALGGDHGLHAILDVVVEGDSGKEHASILKDYQLDPIRGKITHVDLQEVRLDEVITATVVIELVGEAPGAKAGGVLSQVMREIHVEALPMDVPERIIADVSGMELGATLRLGDLPELEKAKFLDDPETVLATVTLPTRVVEPEVEAAAEEAEGEAPAEGDAETQSRTPASRGRRDESTAKPQGLAH